MKTYLYVLFLITGYFTCTMGQSNSFDSWVNSVVIDSTGIIYAGTNVNGIYFSTDGGNRWEQSQMKYSVNVITLKKPGTVISYSYGYSFSEYLFSLSAGGSKLDSIKLSITPTNLYSSDKGILYATTYSSGIYKSTDDGLSWNQINNNYYPLLYSNVFIAINDSILLSSASFGINISTNGGQSWSWAKGIYDSLYIKQFIKTPTGNIYAGGYLGMGVNSNQIYVSSDSGKSWSLFKNVKFDIEAIASDTGGNLYIGGKDGVYRVTEKGDTTYSGLVEAVHNGTGIKSIVIDDENNIYAGAWGGVYKSTDAGASWILLNDGMTVDTSGSSNFTNPLPFGVYISAGIIDNYGNFIAGTDSAGVFRSTDKGKTWVQTNLTIPGINGFTYDSVGTYHIQHYFASSLNDGVFISADGISWQPTSTILSDRMVYTLCSTVQRFPRGGTDSTNMLSTGVVVAGTDWGIYYYCDVAYFPWEGTGYFSSPVYAITTLPSNDVITSTLSGDVYLYPSSFTSCTFKGNMGAQVIAIANDNTDKLYAVGPNGAYKSADIGASWMQINNGILDINLISLAVDKAGNIFAGSKNAGDMYKSTDAGESWNKIASLGYPVRCIFLDNDDNVYASAAARLFKYPVTASAIKNEKNLNPENYSLAQNYPNPFNPSTTIDYKIAESGYTVLKVYDLLGREVAKLVDEYKRSGSYKTVFNAKNFASSIYIYILTINNKIISNKMLLLK